MIEKKIVSPLLLTGKARLVEKFPVDYLVREYQRQFEINIKKYFGHVKEIEIYECVKTGYKFYYPFGIGGDSYFYEMLEKFEWYYMPWKWEHEKTASVVKGQEKILEVGSGGLGFAQEMTDRGYDVTGLELNVKSVKRGEELGLKILNHTIEEHANEFKDYYDIVCSYQVLEHVSDVNSFIQSQIDCLCHGGKLIISVPNNDSFIKYTRRGLLNCPPHHMGLWNERSLKGLTSVFNLELSMIYKEPLQKYHYDWYFETVVNRRVNNIPIVRTIFMKLGFKRIAKKIISLFAFNIKGHSIMAIYTKC